MKPTPRAKSRGHDLGNKTKKMEILNQILPFTVSVITLMVGWFSGRRKSAAEVENIKSNYAEKLLKLNNEYLIAPLTQQIDILSQKIQQLEKALSRISDCKYENICPVKNELKSKTNDTKRNTQQ